MENTFQDYFISEQREKTGHDWQQSKSGVAYLIEMFTKPMDLILDPFMCSGTTALSSQKNNRNFIGFEINKENYAESQRRLNAGGLFSNSFQTELSNEEDE